MKWMKVAIVLSLVLVVTLLTGCQRAGSDPQIEAMQRTISEMKTTQTETRKQVESLADLVEELTEVSRKSSRTLGDLKESVEAIRTAAIEKEEKRELREVLNRKLRLAESLGEREQYTGAYKALKELVEEHPDELAGLEARNMLMEWGITEEDMKKADEAVGQAIETNAQRRQTAWDLKGKARDLEQSGDTTGAIRIYQKIAREYSDFNETRWVRGMMVRYDLADTDIGSLSQEDREEAIRQFRIKRRIDSAHVGRHPNLATAVRLLEIIREEPDSPHIEKARRYFSDHHIVLNKEELATLTLDQLKETLGETLERRREREEAGGLIHGGR